MRRKLSLALPLLLFVSLASLSPPANGEDWRAPPLIITSTGVGIPRALHPGAISQISAEEIDALDADHPAQILNILPGLFVNRGSGQEHLTAIRSPVLTGRRRRRLFSFFGRGNPASRRRLRQCQRADGSHARNVRRRGSRAGAGQRALRIKRASRLGQYPVARAGA